MTSRARREAKRLKRETGVSHAAALRQTSRQPLPVMRPRIALGWGDDLKPHWVSDDQGMALLFEGGPGTGARAMVSYSLRQLLDTQHRGLLDVTYIDFADGLDRQVEPMFRNSLVGSEEMDRTIDRRRFGEAVSKVALEELLRIRRTAERLDEAMRQASGSPQSLVHWRLSGDPASREFTHTVLAVVGLDAHYAVRHREEILSHLGYLARTHRAHGVILLVEADASESLSPDHRQFYPVDMGRVNRRLRTPGIIQVGLGRRNILAPDLVVTPHLGDLDKPRAPRCSLCDEVCMELSTICPRHPISQGSDESTDMVGLAEMARLLHVPQEGLAPLLTSALGPEGLVEETLVCSAGELRRWARDLTQHTVRGEKLDQVVRELQQEVEA